MVPTVLLPPATLLTCQVTAVFERLLTVAVKVVVLPSRTWLAPLTVIDGCGCVEELRPEPQPLIKNEALSASARKW
jgi:hypothetical protein